MEKIMLIVEKSKGGLWGRIHYEDNLLIENARTVESLERKMKKLLKGFHDVDTRAVSFEIFYDLTAMFESFNYLKISAVAEHANMNAALLRQYASGVKHPSAAQAKKVERAIHKIGSELTKIAIYAPCVVFIIAAFLRWLLSLMAEPK